MSNIFNSLIKFPLYLLVFLLPLFFLPFSFEAYEFNKQYLLFFLVSLAFLAWIAKMVICDKGIKFRRTPLDTPVLIFLFVAILSTIFSVDKISSLLGFYGRFSDGLIGLLSLGVLYFLITNNIGIANNGSRTSIILLNSLLKVFLWSSFFVILISYFSLFGIWAKIQSFTGLKLPSVMLQRTFNLTSGSMEGLSIFLSIVAVLLVGLLLFSGDYKSRAKTFFYYFLLAVSLLLLIIADLPRAWIVLGLTLFLFVCIALWKRIFRGNINSLLLPIAIIIIAAIFLMANPLKGEQGLSLARGLPQEQVLDQETSWRIAARTATENIKSGFLGSGIGTFYYAFSKFKSVEFNQNWFWQIRFDRTGTHFAEILGTMGFLGLISYIVLFGMFLLISYFFLQQNRNGVPLFLALFALLVGQFVYYQNTVLAFTFWLFLGLSVISWQRPIAEKTISFKDFPELSLVFSVFLVVLGLAILGSYFFAGRFYLADIAFANAFRTATHLPKLQI